MQLFRKTAFGIDISDSSVKAVELKPKNGSAKVRTYHSFVLPKGLVKRGEIKKPEELTQIIKNELRPGDKSIFSSDNCIFALPEPEVFTDVIEMKEVSKEMGGKVLDHIQNRFPFKIENINFDWDVIAETDEMSDVFVAAAEKTTVQSYVNVLKNAGFNPVLAEFQALANARALFDTHACETMSPVMVIDFGKSYTSLYIYDECGVRLSTLSNATGDNFTKEIFDSIGGTKKKAEQLKKKHGLSLSVKGRSKKRVLQDPVDRAILQIQSVKERYEKKTDRTIKELVLAGKAAKMPYLLEYLKKKLELKVSIGNPLRAISNNTAETRKIKKDLSITACGLAMRSFNSRYNDEINLIK